MPKVHKSILIEMGTMRAGDVENNNIVNTTDFTALKASFGLAPNSGNYDNRSDFNGDSAVNTADFTLLRSNFGTGGAPPIVPVRASSTPTPYGTPAAYPGAYPSRMEPFNEREGADPTRPGGPNTVITVTYLHSDHLGSISVATNPNGTLASSQEFDPWGVVRQGGVSETSLNYTGQRLDATGLLYYHARYYDPSLARFISPDSIVPDGGPGKEGNTI